jgi:hypothetical protein
MVTGSNRVFSHDGRDFHIQVEDLGKDNLVEVRVYDKGAVLFVKRMSYEAALAQRGDTPPDEAIRGFMEKTIQTVMGAIAKGKIQ